MSIIKIAGRNRITALGIEAKLIENLASLRLEDE